MSTLIEPRTLTIEKMPPSPVQPDRLLGRSAEQSILLNSYFASLSKGRDSPATLILIRGDSGLGKTKLAESLRPHVIGDDGYFIQGKFDKLSYGSASRPYSGISSAFAEYIAAVEQRSEETWSELVEKLRGEMSGGEGRLLAKAIPSLGKIVVGECREKGALRKQHSCDACQHLEEMTGNLDISSESGSHRFIYLIKRVVSVISSIGDPIVCLIDDIQWANKTDIDVLKALMAGAINPIVFIFTCRPGNHAFLKITDEYEGKTEVILRSLTQNSVCQLVAEMLRTDEDCTSLANFISRVANGNPFFIQQQIYSLRDEGFICFGDSGCWTWDINAIEQMHGDVSGNVVIMLSEKMKRLLSLTQQALVICSCIGSRVDLYILGLIIRETHFVEASVSEENETLAKTAISIASQEGLVAVTEDGKRITFTHDSVNEAAYSLLEPEHEASYHLKLGQILQKNIRSNLFQKYVFTVAAQLARGSQLLIKEEDDRIDAIKIFLSAGEKSHLASAFPEARFFLSKGIQLSREDDWTENYRLCCDIYMKAADAAALMGDFGEMNKCLTVLFFHCKNFSHVDFLNASYIQARALTTKGDPAALDVGLEALRLAGETIPSRNLALHALLGLVRTRYLMKGKGAEELFQIPPVTDGQMIATQRLLEVLANNAFSHNQKLLPLVCFKTVQMNLAHGMSEAMPSAIATYGFILCRLGYSTAEAAKYSEIALALQGKIKDNEASANIVFLTSPVFSMTKKLSDILKPLRLGFDSGVRTGDITHAMGCATATAMVCFFSGQRLTKIAKTLDKLRASLSEYNMTRGLRMNLIYRNAVDYCIGVLDASRFFVTADINDDTSQSRTNTVLCEQAKFVQLVAAVIFGECGLSWAMSDKLGQFSKIFTGSVWAYICAFYRGLAATSMLQISKSRNFIKTTKSCLKQLRRGKKKSVMNISHQICLLEAEYAVVRKKYSSAETLYLLAIEEANLAGVTHEHAQACERFGMYYLLRKNHIASYEYIREAHRLYLKWGSHPKCELLKKKFPKLADEELLSPK